MKHFINALRPDGARLRLGGRFLVTLCTALIASCAGRQVVVQEDGPSWALEFERPLEFQLLVNDDLLVAGTLRHLYGIDPGTGRVLWRKRNVAVSGTDLTPLPDDRYLLVNDAAGGAFHDRDTNIITLEPASGEIAWESRAVEGKILQGALDEAGDVLYFASVARSHGDDRGFLSGALGKGLGAGYEQVPVLSALDVNSGRVLWRQAFEQPVRMRPSYARQLDDKADWSHTRPFDLEAYHPPVVTEDRVCVTWAGVHCYDRATGELAWKRRFDVLENDLALSYAHPVVHGEVIIVSGQNRVRAYALTDGKTRWRSERLDIVTELTLDGDLLYGQLGGRYLDLDDEEWKWKGDFGVFALDVNTGRKRWEFDDADDAVSNLLVYGEAIWLADEDDLVALDRRTGDVVMRRDHDFEAAPEFVALNALAQVVVIGDGRVAAYDAKTGEVFWTVHHPPIGPGAWSRFGDGMRRSTGNVLKFFSFVVARVGGVLPSLSLPLGSVNFTVISTKRVVSGQMARSGRRMAYRSGAFEGGEGNAALSGNFQYFVTQPRGHDKPALAVVNLATGETERYIRMDAERPNLVINEAGNKVYQAFDRELVALRLERLPASESLAQEPRSGND